MLEEISSSLQFCLSHVQKCKLILVPYGGVRIYMELYYYDLNLKRVYKS